MKNVELARAFLHEVLARPSILERIPTDARLVLIPPSEPELARRNLSIAYQMVEFGESVFLQRVGVPDPDVPAWHETELRSLQFQWLVPRFPVEAPKFSQADWAITYERQLDTLIVDLYGRRQPGMAVPINPHMGLWVDQRTHEIVGYVLAQFLQTLVSKVPQLVNLLSTAELVGATDDEIAEWRRARESKLDEEETLLSLGDELDRVGT